MSKAKVWVLQGEPKDVRITDKNGKNRSPNLEKIKATPRLKDFVIRKRGVGNLFYGGLLGRKADLEAQGNTHTTNVQILRAIGYVPEEVEIDPK